MRMRIWKDGNESMLGEPVHSDEFILNFEINEEEWAEIVVIEEDGILTAKIVGNIDLEM